MHGRAHPRPSTKGLSRSCILRQHHSASSSTLRQLARAAITAAACLSAAARCRLTATAAPCHPTWPTFPAHKQSKCKAVGAEEEAECGKTASSFSSMTMMFGGGFFESGIAEACECKPADEKTELLAEYLAFFYREYGGPDDDVDEKVEAIAKTPIFATCTGTLTGLTTIRAFGMALPRQAPPCTLTLSLASPLLSLSPISLCRRSSCSVSRRMGALGMRGSW